MAPTTPPTRSMIGGTNTLGIARRGGCTCIDCANTSPRKAISIVSAIVMITPPLVLPDAL